MSQPSLYTQGRLRFAWPRRAHIAIAVLAVAIVWIFAGAAGLPLQLSDSLYGLITVFLGIFIEALPFLLAGVLVSSAIHLFVSPERIRRLSPRSTLRAAVAGSLIGLAFPVCECGSIPAARRLLAKGAPASLGIAFVLAAPVINPIVIVSTLVAFGNRPEIVAGRIALTILIAVVVGLAIGSHPQPSQLLAPLPAAHEHEHATSIQAAPNRFQSFVEHASGEFVEMGRYLVFGSLIAATLQTIAPRAMLLELGQGPVISALALMALASLLSICSTVDAFVALAFVGSFMPGAILAFLVFGPMIDLKSVLMLGSTFRRRTVALIVLLTFQMTLLAAVVINLYLI
ncbi:MAG TPA: permease [Anaerolineae bacterium]|nr:permease [Anaerolineae bacterium]